jgi:succinate dehydrogenase / fumarate reductase membrane anchor subunit
MRPSHHWLHQRISAFILLIHVPIAWWCMHTLSGAAYDQWRQFMKQPIVLLGLTVFITLLVYHIYLGMQVVIEDYTKGTARSSALLILKLVCAMLLGFFALSVFQLFQGA